MASYLLIESRDNFRTGGAGFCHDLARWLAGAANRVTLFLVQNRRLDGKGLCPNHCDWINGLAVMERDIHDTAIAPVETSTRPSSAQSDRSARLVTPTLADIVGFRGSLAASVCATGQDAPAI